MGGTTNMKAKRDIRIIEIATGIIDSGRKPRYSGSRSR